MTNVTREKARPMQFHTLSYEPSLDPAVVKERLNNLLLPGPLDDQVLDRRIQRIESAFKRYAMGIYHGLWSPGLVITNEMRAQAESMLPLQEILPLFNHLFARATSSPLFLGASAIHNALSWPDALHALQDLAAGADPAALLRILLMDEGKRRLFFFRDFIPDRYGGSFNRYPQQMAFLGDWLGKNGKRFDKGWRCLDAACGTGEGTYDLAGLLLQRGLLQENFNICGSTIEPFELFAAAHAFFPHDLQRQKAYRRQVGPLFAHGACRRMVFRLEDIVGTQVKGESYHVILCNGLLGGPFLHDRGGLESAVVSLARRLEPGGILLAADRFHAGWKKKAPATLLAEIFSGMGLEVLELDEGLAGIKNG